MGAEPAPEPQPELLIARRKVEQQQSPASVPGALPARRRIDAAPGRRATLLSKAQRRLALPAAAFQKSGALELAELWSQTPAIIPRLEGFEDGMRRGPGQRFQGPEQH